MEFKKYVEVQTRRKLKILMRNDGGKFTSKEFEEVLKVHGIQHQNLTPYTRQHNVQ
jgi:transposase InsO family protein